MPGATFQGQFRTDAHYQTRTQEKGKNKENKKLTATDSLFDAGVVLGIFV